MITTKQFGIHVCAPTYFESNPDLTEANAALIVTAVNSHEALVEACREASEIVIGEGMNEQTANKLKDALKLAGVTP